MPKHVLPWLAAAGLAVAVIFLALTGDSGSSEPEQSAAYKRLVAAFDAIDQHRYGESCKYWHPYVFLAMGINPADCDKVLDYSFPPSQGFAYRVRFGGPVTKNTEAYAVEVATGQYAAECEKAWAAGEECDNSSVFVVRVDLDNPAKSVGWKRGVPPGRHWYITGAGAV